SQRASRAVGTFQIAREVAGGPAIERADAVRRRNEDGDGLLPGNRELQPAAEWPQAGRAAVHAIRFLPEGLPADCGRVARLGAAGRGDVQWRPEPQGNARRTRLPFAERAGQST